MSNHTDGEKRTTVAGPYDDLFKSFESFNFKTPSYTEPDLVKANISPELSSLISEREINYFPGININEALDKSQSDLVAFGNSLLRGV